MTDICKQSKAYDSMSQTSTQGDDLLIMPIFPNSSKQQNTKNAKAKSSLCRNYSQKGYCPYGYKCQFAHGVEELRCKMEENSYKTKTCNAFTKKIYCKYGLRCNFLHQKMTEVQKEDAFKNYRDLIYQSKNLNQSHFSFAKTN